jgi:flagellin
MTSINTNIASLMAQSASKQVTNDMETAMQRLSTGLRINSASDDAAGVAIVSKMEAQIRGLNQAIRNAADGQALASTAEGAIVEIESMLQRMRELSVQAANDTNSSQNREDLNNEITQLQEEIDRIVNTTQFNGFNILDGSAELSFMIGANAGQTMDVSIASLGTASLGSINGASTVSSVRNASFQGNAAEVTQAQLGFAANDTYSFTLTVNTGGDDVELDISGRVQNGSAVAIANAINTAAETADIDDYVSASASGSTVTISNSYGEKIHLDSFVSTSNSSATFATLNGGADSDESAVLGTTANNVGTTFTTNADAAAYSAGSDAEAGVAAVYTWNTESIDIDTGEANAITDGSTVEVNFGAYTADILAADATSWAELAAAINDKTTDWVFSYSEEANTLTATAQNAEAHAAGEIVITEKDADGDAVAGSFTADGITSTESTAGADAVDAVAASGGTNVYLEMLSADDYSFTLTADGTDYAIEFSYSGTSASRDSIATQIGTTLGSTFTVTHEEGQIRIIEEGGNAVEITAFTSASSGRMIASTDVATAGDQGTSELLDDTSYADNADTNAAGTADATVVDLSFTAEDTYSFKISDGVSTAVIDPTSVADDADTADVEMDDVADMVAAIEYGLARAGMDSSITVAEADGVITLTQAAGRVITISDFTSDADGSMEVVKGSDDTTGTAKYLDDGNATNAATVSGISVTTSSNAANAIDILDRAITDVAAERAKLGAAMNRLDHTISNLTSVSMQTNAAMGLIQDADFASESTALSKSQILSQAATAMLAQANQSKQTVLALLQG